MGLEIAKAFITVAANTQQVGMDLHGLKTEADRQFGDIRHSAENSALGMEQAFSNSAANVKRVMQSILGAVSSYIGAATIWKGLAYAGEYEETKVAFETMIGTAEETEALLARLTDFAAKTPFEMPGIQQVARGLLTFGERGDELMDTLKVLGDASGGTAMNFQMLGMVFNQVRGVGKLLTQDFRQLSTRGILFLTDIAKYYNVTEAEANSMLSTGKIAFEDVKEILRQTTEEGGRNFNMMEKQSKTYKGLMSTLSDNIGLTFRAVGEGILPVARNITDMMNKVVDSFRAVVAALGPVAGYVTVATTAVVSLTTAIMSARVAMQMMGLTFKQVLIGSGWGIALLAIGIAVGLLLAGIQKLYTWLMSLKPVQEAVAIAMSRIKDAWSRLSIVIVEAGGKIYKALSDAASRILASFGIKMEDLPYIIGTAFAELVDVFADIVITLIRDLERMVEGFIWMWDKIKGIIDMGWYLIKWSTGITTAIMLVQLALAGMGYTAKQSGQELNKLAKSLDEVSAKQNPGGSESSTQTDSGGTAAVKAATAKLQRQMEIVGYTADEVERWDLAQLGVNERILNTIDLQKRQYQAAQAGWKLREDVYELSDALERQTRTMGMSAEAMQLADLRARGLSGAWITLIRKQQEGLRIANVQHEFNKFTESLQAQRDAIGKTADELTLLKFEQDGVSPSALEATRQFQAQTRAMEEAHQKAKTLTDTIKEFTRSQREQRATAGFSSDEMERFRAGQLGASSEQLAGMAKMQRQTELQVTMTQTLAGLHEQISEAGLTENQITMRRLRDLGATREELEAVYELQQMAAREQEIMNRPKSQMMGIEQLGSHFQNMMLEAGDEAIQKDMLAELRKEHRASVEANKQRDRVGDKVITAIKASRGLA